MAACGPLLEKIVTEPKEKNKQTARKRKASSEASFKSPGLFLTFRKMSFYGHGTGNALRPAGFSSLACGSDFL